MESIWEVGDRIYVRRYENKDLIRREYAMCIIARDPRPFIEMKMVHRFVQGNISYDLYYHVEGLQSLFSYLRISMCRNRLDIYKYLKLMYQVLDAMEEAEEKMIMTSSFEINAETIWYCEKEERVRFLYIPVYAISGEPQGSLWKSRSAPRLLLELMEEVKRLDPGFHDRWPHLQKYYWEWEENNTGRHRCMGQIKRWLKEFPKEFRESW